MLAAASQELARSLLVSVRLARRFLAATVEDRADALGALSDLGLTAARGGLVVAPAGHTIGRVLLVHHPGRVVMRVDVALAVTQPGSARVARVPQVLRHRPGQARGDVGTGRPDGLRHG